ncbi:MAG: ABC transporter permease, partial [Moraxella osloensis]
MLIKHPVWQARIHRFRRNRLGFFSLIMFSLIFLACMGANF